MKIYKLEFEQIIKNPINECWDFFSNPNNLEFITPKDLSFRIISGNESKMYQGQIIRYRIILNKIPLEWITEITHLKEGEFFVDEQRAGPYKFWHHQHFFIKHKEGTLIKDIVHYSPGFFWLGDFINFLFLKRKLLKIFEYRGKSIEKLFDH